MLTGRSVVNQRNGERGGRKARPNGQPAEVSGCRDRLARPVGMLFRVPRIRPRRLRPDYERKTMSQDKRDYLSRIRSETAYPAFRGVVSMVAVLGYLLASLIAVAALISGFLTLGMGFLLFIPALLVYYQSKFLKEGAIILADLSDSMTDANSRNPR